MRRPAMPPVLEIAGWLVAIGLATWAQFRFNSGNTASGVAFALGGIGLLAIVSGDWWRWAIKPDTDAPSPSDAMPLSLEVPLVIAVFVWAAAVRFWGLTDFPPYIFVDESHRAIEAVRAASGNWVSPWSVGWWSVPSLYFYYASWFARWFGHTEFAIRIPCAVSGTLTVWVFYPLARRLFGPRWALVVTFLLASSRWHFNVSRWGGEEVAMPLFWTLCLLGVAVAFRCRPWWGVWKREPDDAPAPRAWSRRRLFPAALGGIGLGLALYTYAAARLLPLALACFFIHQAIFRRRFFRQHLLAAILLVLVSLAVFAPLGRFYLREPFHLTHRFREVSIFPEIGKQKGYAPLGRSIAAHLGMFHVEGDHNPRHNLPGAPMLDPVTGVLFLLGLGVMIGRIHEPLSGLVLFALLGGMAAGILTKSHQAPQTFRAIAVVIGVYLAIGLGLARLGAVLGRLRAHRVPRLLPIAFLGAAALWAAQHEARLYFQRQMQDRAVLLGFNPVMTAASREVRDAFRATPNRQIYVWGDLHGWSTLQFFEMDKFHGGPNCHLLQPFDATNHMPILMPETRAVSIFLRPEHTEQRAQIARYYPNAQWQRQTLEDLPDAEYLRCDIPKRTIDAHRGLETVCTPLDGSPPTRTRDTQIDFAWNDIRDLPKPLRKGFDITWKGCLAAKRASRAGLSLVAVSAPETPPVPGRIILDGQEIYRLDTPAGNTQTRPVIREIALAPGPHDLEVHAHWQPGYPQSISLIRTKRGHSEIVEAADLFDYRIPPNGLWATYYRGVEWKGEPLFRRRERAVSADPQVASPFSVRWEGVIRIPRAGAYRFEPNSDDGCEVFVDGKRAGWDPGPGRGQRGATPVRLSAGFHDIRIDYWEQGGGRNLTVWFFAPGQGRRPLPGDLLLPIRPH